MCPQQSPGQRWSHLGVCSLQQLNGSPLRRKLTLLLKILFTCWRASLEKKPGSFCNEKSSSFGAPGLSGVWLHTQSDANTCTWAVLTLLWHGHRCGCLHRDPTLSHGPAPFLAAPLEKNHHCKSIYYCKKPSRCEQYLAEALNQLAGLKQPSGWPWLSRKQVSFGIVHIIPGVTCVTSSTETWWDRACACWRLEAVLIHALAPLAGPESNTGVLPPRWLAWMRRQRRY